MIEATVKDILTNSKTENERNIKLGGALDIEINKYFGMDSQAYIESLAAKEMKDVETPVSLEQEIQERYLISKQKEIYRMNLQNIKNLETDIKNSVISSRDFTGKSKQEEASPRDIKIMQNKIQRIKNSNLELLESGRGGIDLKNKISRKEKELESLNNRLPLLKENLSPTRFEVQLEKVSTLETEIEELEQEYSHIGILENADEKKKTELSPNYDNPEYNKLLDLHLDRLGIDSKEPAIRDLNELASFILEAESDGNFNAVNLNKKGEITETSARGGYQFKPLSVDPAIVRLERRLGRLPRFDEVRKTGDVRSLSPEDQTLLFMADILEKTAYINNEPKPGYGDKLFNDFLNADNKKDKQKQLMKYMKYYIIHK